MDFKPITNQRLGKSDGKIRSLEISLNTPSEVFNILGLLSRLLKSDKISNEIKIMSDKIPQQCSYFHNLYRTLNDGHSNGESNITIKYFKGHPSIVNHYGLKNLMKTTGLYIYFQNVRSLVSKISTLSPVLATSCFDVISFSETWLSPSIFNSELNFTNYIIYRCDRSPISIQ